MYGITWLSDILGCYRNYGTFIRIDRFETLFATTRSLRRFGGVLPHQAN
jgi:hypothetical protein